MEKKKGQVQIIICDNNVNPFIETLHNVLLAPDLCDGLFSIITLMNLGHTCLFHKGLLQCTLDIRRKIWWLWHILHRGNIYFWFKKIRLSKRKCHLRRNFPWNYYTIDWETYIPDNLWMEILKMFGRILNLGYIQNLLAHHVRYLQWIKMLCPRLHLNQSHL